MSEQALNGMRIFYVEDNENNRIVVQTLLEKMGAKFATEKWGFSELILPKIRDFRPNLILLDLMLPANTSGYDVYDALQRTPLASVPVVVVSAADASTEIPKCQQKGINGFIGKPINRLTFGEHLRRVIDGEKVWIAEDQDF